VKDSICPGRSGRNILEKLKSGIFLFFYYLIEITVYTRLIFLRVCALKGSVTKCSHDKPTGPAAIYAAVHTIQVFRRRRRTDTEIMHMIATRLSPASLEFPAVQFSYLFLLHGDDSF